MYEYLPNTQPIFARGAVNTLNRDFDIVTTITANPSGITEGVIFAHGNRFGGYTLFVKDDEICFVYNLCGIREYRVTAPLLIDDGPTKISVLYKKEVDHTGTVRLIVGNAAPVKGRIGMTIPWVLPAHQQPQLRPRPRPVSMPRLRIPLRLHRPGRPRVGHRRRTGNLRQSQNPGSRPR